MFNLLNSIAICVQASTEDGALTPVILGPVGGGKTSMVRYVADRLGMEHETQCPSHLDPVELAGGQVATTKGLEKFPPAWARKFIRESDGGFLPDASDKRGVVIFDEFLQGAPMSFDVLQGIVQEGRVAGRVLQAARVCIGNPPDLVGGHGNEMTLAVQNRVIIIEVDPAESRANRKEFHSGQQSLWKPPILRDGWEEAIPALTALKEAFLDVRPDLDTVYPKDGERLGGFPTGRSWDTFVRVQAAVQGSNLSGEEANDVLHRLGRGAVGEVAARAFLEWRSQLDLPNPADVLENPGEFEVPERTDLRYVILSTLVSYTVSTPTIPNWKAVWKILGKYAEAGNRGLAVSQAGLLCSGIEVSRAKAREKGRRIPDFPPTDEIGLLIPALNQAAQY